LVVMAVMPLGLIGTIWGHWHWDLALNIFSIVGLIGLSGIIINNAILIVVTADGYGLRRATVPSAVAAAGDRLRPILITTLTTVFGLGPLVFERSQQALFLKPTVVTLVYGLGIGAILVLVLVPALLVAQRDFVMLLRGLRRGLRTRHGLGAVVRWASIAALGWLVATLTPWLKGGAGPAGWLMGLLPGLTPG